MKLARRMEALKPSAVREILKITERPEIISFAGGLPAAELFPVDAFRRAHDAVLTREGPAALQYSTTEGLPGLRAWVAEQLRARGVPTAPQNVLITAGSQQGIDLCTKVFLDPKGWVAVENPTYLAALQTFTGYEARLLAAEGDGEGLMVDELASGLSRARPAFVYVVPDFQNPRGTTMSLKRREALAALARAQNLLILEDDPYGELRYRGPDLPPLAALAPERVIRLGTFSKTLAPGLRVGWAAGPKELIALLTIAKQSCDLHTSSLSQRVILELLLDFDYAGHLGRLRRVYGERAQTMIEALEEHLPGCAFTRPDGGLFLWLELPSPCDAEALLASAVARRVAFVPGAPFYARSPQHRMARLNFSNAPPAQIELGIRRLAQTVRAAQERNLGLEDTAAAVEGAHP